ncbi:hypothetical protein VTL71DRAFT_13518 [Oculimacula yallundae]|uniref:Uncharacterized protein n=1 Tax=Oculimacula yallundae TaxID=86028 RepID=A0ABR4CKK6_9HELO
MTRCMVYIHNQTKQNLQCVNFAGSDFHRINSGVAPPGTAAHAVGAMDCPEGNDSNWELTDIQSSEPLGTLFFQRDYGSHQTYFQLYFQLRSKDDCMAMGTSMVTKQDVDRGQGVANVDADMPSNGMENADKYTRECFLQWRPSKSSADTLGNLDWPVMYVAVFDEEHQF